MRILYVFPHPDDESFGPAPAISKQRRQGHEVFLLTLTKGGATKIRHKFDYSIEQMGEVRYGEMKEMAKVLDLTELTVLDLPDSGLKKMDPRKIERVVAGAVERIRPDILVSYPVHGVSGFHDHLVMHAVIKRVYLELKEKGAHYLKRLAFFTIAKPEKQEGIFTLSWSTDEEIDCVFTTDSVDMDNFIKALDCYETYREVIEKTGVKKSVSSEIVFEIFQEDHNPPLTDLCDGIE